MKLKIKKNHPQATIPATAYGEGDAAVDLHACEEVVIKPGERALVNTGLQIAVPAGYFANIRDRSGLAIKHGIHTMAGVVDSHYRGDYKIVLINFGQEDYKIKIGDRIAQLLIQKVEDIEWQEVEELDKTKRGAGSFGSSGY